jgi:hypothetical protein
MEKVTKLWHKLGQQRNSCQVAVLEALSEGYSKVEIARAVWLEVFSSKKNPWNGVGNKDNLFDKIYGCIMRIKQAYESGQLDRTVNPINSSDLQSKSLKPTSCG